MRGYRSCKFGEFRASVRIVNSKIILYNNTRNNPYGWKKDPVMDNIEQARIKNKNSTRMISMATRNSRRKPEILSCLLVKSTTPKKSLARRTTMCKPKAVFSAKVSRTFLHKTLPKDQIAREDDLC